MWLPEYRNHSYIRIREMESGDVVQNISLSIGFGFGAAFVDYGTVRVPSHGRTEFDENLVVEDTGGC